MIVVYFVHITVLAQGAKHAQKSNKQAFALCD